MKRSLLFLLACAIGTNVSYAQSKFSSRKINDSRQIIERTQLKKANVVQGKVELPFTSQKDVKVLKSYVKNGNGMEYVQLPDGSVKKRIVKNNISYSGFPVPPKSSVQTKSTDDYLLFESFEDNNYDEDPYWVPNGWVEISKVGSTVDGNFMGNGDETWHPNDQFTPSASTSLDPTDGGSLMMIDPVWHLDMETFIMETKLQDEWLITKEFTPDQNSSFNFDFSDSPFWNYYYYFDVLEPTFDFSEAKAILEIYISTDGGETWPDKVWDSTPSELKIFNEQNIYDYDIAEWKYIEIDLTAYVGKNIKVAFRYVGNDGSSVAIDNVIVGEKAPIAKYDKPQGAFFASWNSELSYYTFMLGAAYTNTMWNNSSLYAKTFDWIMADSNNPPDAVYNSDDKNPSDFYMFSLYKTPSLTANSATKTSEYHWGAEFIDEDGNPAPVAKTQILTGGNINDVIPEEGADFYSSNVPPNAYIRAYTMGGGLPIFGPREGVSSIGSYFEKPLAIYMIEGVRIPVVGLTVPADTELKLNIYKMPEKGVAGDLIASSTVYYPTAVSGNGLSNISFDEFSVIDPTTGLDVTVDYLEIDEAILVEFAGFEGEMVGEEGQEVYQNDIDFTALCTIDEGDSFGYFLEDGVWKNARRSLSVNSSLVVLMDVTYPFLYAEENRFEAPAAGGTHTFSITDYYWLPEDKVSNVQWWIDNEIPEWISVGDLRADDGQDPVSVPVTVAALPEGVKGRAADLILKSYGCELKLQIKQGESFYVSIPEVKVSNVRAYVNNNNIYVAYPEGTTSVSVYNAVGQLVGNYRLDPSGAAILPGANLTKGIYFLKFSGKTNETIKVVK